jgi:DsbC/DsbD-like thiol-disulfide interchange protein
MFRFLFSCFIAVASPVLADGFATDWSAGTKSRARLLAGGEISPGHYRLAIDVELAPNTITYWRNPGEAGLPPQFSFEGSDNVATAELRFPAPKKLLEAGLAANGYKAHVTFPLEIVARDARLPVRLNYQFDYAVCEKLCIPAKASGLLQLPHEAGSYSDVIGAAEAKIPLRHPLGMGGELAIVAITPEGGDKNLLFRVEIRAPEAAELFLEVTEPLFATLEPLTARQFRLRFDPLPSGVDLAAQKVRLTLVGENHAVETEIRLDGMPLTP